MPIDKDNLIKLLRTLDEEIRDIRVHLDTLETDYAMNCVNKAERIMKQIFEFLKAD
jgi:hypothetical protein